MNQHEFGGLNRRRGHGTARHRFPEAQRPEKTRTGAISGRDPEARTVDGHLRARDRA